MKIPSDNAMTTRRVELGKLLFFDKALSADSSIACISCHLPSNAFSDNRAFSTGVNNQPGLRNTPSLGNIGWHTSYFKDGGVATLETQAFVPITDPHEMAFTINGVIDRMKRNPYYLQLSRIAYEREPDLFVISRALAAYQRTLITGNSRFDRYFYHHETTALNESEKRGLALFMSARTQCSSCHSGFDFTDYSFRNIGLYEVYADTGRKRITLIDSDYGKFKVPSLRNVEITAPYMHDGSVTSLEAVIEHYNLGGKNNAYQDPNIQPLQLTQTEKNDLLNFMKSLTDLNFIEE